MVNLKFFIILLFGIILWIPIHANSLFMEFKKNSAVTKKAILHSKSNINQPEKKEIFPSPDSNQSENNISLENVLKEIVNLKKDIFETTANFYSRRKLRLELLEDKGSICIEKSLSCYSAGEATMRSYDADKEHLELDLHWKKKLEKLLPNAHLFRHAYIKIPPEDAKKFFQFKSKHFFHAKLEFVGSKLSINKLLLLGKYRLISSEEKNLINRPVSLETFLNEYLKSGTGKITRQIVNRYFAQKVHPYYSILNANREDIYQDKIRYSKRWPERNYWLKSYHVVNQYSMRGQKYIEVIMTLGWRVYSSKRGERRGESAVSITLDITNGYHHITALQSAKIRHDIPDRSLQSITHDKNKKIIHINDEGVAVEIEYPKVVYTDEIFTLTARMTNHTGHTAKQGGLTLSFPDIMQLSGSINQGNFHSVQSYSYPDQIYNNSTHTKMPTEYFMVEGWHKYKWYNGAMKYFTVSLRAPRNLSKLKVNIRGILWIQNKYDTRKAPASSLTRDQQGFAVRQFVINVQ